LLFAVVRKLQHVTQIHTALIANPMVSHRTLLQQFDEKRPRHPEYVSGSLCRDDLIIWNQSYGFAVNHEAHNPFENFIHCGRQLNAVPGTTYQPWDTTFQQALKLMGLRPFNLRQGNWLLYLQGHNER
jgi:hypothetical protein